MTSAKSPAPVDTTGATRAYLLAVAHAEQLAERLPSGLLSALAADLTTFGADPRPRSPEASPAPPRLADALAAAISLITALHGAVIGAGATGEVRRAYGVKANGASLEAKDVLAVGDKIAARALANPTEALSLGILAGDLAELASALADVRAAEAVARAEGGGAVTAKERRAAEARMKDAVARIAGAGALAFAKDAALRAEFAALSG